MLVNLAGGILWLFISLIQSLMKSNAHSHMSYASRFIHSHMWTNQSCSCKLISASQVAKFLLELAPQQMWIGKSLCTCGKHDQDSLMDLWIGLLVQKPQVPLVLGKMPSFGSSEQPHPLTGWLRGCSAFLSRSGKLHDLLHFALVSRYKLIKKVSTWQLPDFGVN